MVSSNSSSVNEYPYSIYKYSFESLDDNLYGLGYIIFNVEDKHIQDKGIILYDSPNQAKLKINDPWRRHVKEIKALSHTEAYKEEMCQDILINIEKGISYNDIITIERYVQDKQTMQIATLLKAILERIFLSKDLVMLSDLELISQDEYVELLNTKDPPLGDLQFNIADEGLDDSSDTLAFFDVGNNILLECYPVLAPISGIPVFNLKNGDEIMVRIVDDKKGQLASKVLQMDPKKNLLISAKIQKIQFKDDNHQLLVHIRNNYYGRIIESEKIKIKSYNQDEIPPEETLPLEVAPLIIKENPIFTKVMIGVAIVMVLLTLIIIMAI